MSPGFWILVIFGVVCGTIVFFSEEPCEDSREPTAENAGNPTPDRVE